MDWASLTLLGIGLAFGVLAYRLIIDQGTDPLVLVPSVVAVVLALPNVVQRRVPRDKR